MFKIIASGMTSLRLVSVVVFLLCLFIVIPFAIAATGRTDLYYTLTSVALLSIASAGVWLTFYIGRINIGQGAFCLIGAYASAILVTKFGLSFWLSLPAAGFVGVIASILIGLPILRLRGVYFAMVTLVLTQVVTLTALALPITNGAKGMTSLPLPGALKIAGFTLIPPFETLANPRLGFYYLACFIMCLTFAAVWRLVHSRLGHICRAMQQNEALASAVGIHVSYVRIIIFAISSFFGALGGAMFGAIAQSVYPSSFQVVDSVNFMLNCFLGGLGFVFGPMLGTLVLYFGWDLLFGLGKFQLLVYASLLILLMLILPNGLLSLPLVSRKRGKK